MAPSKMAALGYQNLWTRAAILLCFWSAILVSIPYWLRFTTIQRLSLPKSAVQSLETASECPVLFDTSLDILVDSELMRDDHALFLQQVRELVQDSLDIKNRLETGTSLECVRWNVTTRLHEEHDSIPALAFDSDHLTYTVHVIPASSPAVAAQFATVRIGDPQHVMLPDATSAAIVAHILKVRGDTPRSIEANTPSTATAAAEQDPRIIQYSKHVRLVFSIMNQDITSGAAYDSALLHNLARSEYNDTSFPNPVADLLDELTGLHDFHVESQVQWYAPLHFTPTQEKLEEVIEVEDEEVVLVDEEVEEEVEIDLTQDPEESRQSPSAESASIHDTADEEEVEVDALLPTKRTEKRKVMRKVPRLQKVVRQTRTPLPTRHVVEWDDLKVFVNSAEWSLISTAPPAASVTARADKRPFDRMSHTHDLHFLLYVPSQSNAPLLLRSPSGEGVSDANAWLIPQWGGVVILNPPSATETDVAVVPSSRDSQLKQGVNELPMPQVEQAVELFARQLRILLGLGSEPRATDSEYHEVELDQNAEVARKARLQVLFQRRILETARETVNTLGGIVRLVDKIENLGVGPDVQHDVQLAIQALHSLDDESVSEALSFSPAHVSSHLPDVLSKVQHAHALANRAFFNPDMLALLYFPDEHKYAVYTPLFGPLLVPLVVTTVKLIKSFLSSSASQKVRPQNARSARTSM